MISDFNKSNPFVIIMRTRLEEINNLSISITSFLFKNAIISTIVSLLPLIALKINLISFIPFIVNTIIFIANFMNLRMSINDVNKNEINDILYTNKYSVINVNNEQLLTIIERINIYKGRLTNVKDYTQIMNLVTALLTILITGYKFLF